MILDVRTKATVEEGIIARQELEGRLFIAYAPGNGTQYLLLFTKLDGFGEKVTDLLGIGSKCWMVTVLNQEPRPSAFITDNGQLLHWSYVGEKLGFRTPDAVVVAELIGHITGRPYLTGEEVMSALEEEVLVSSERLPKPEEIGEESVSDT
jgi:hypothetical protein